MLKIALISLTVLCFTSKSSNQQQQSECYSLRRAYESFCSEEFEQAINGRTQGRPGKRGGKGEKGDVGIRGSPGPRGPPSEIDFETMEEIIERRLKKELETVARNITILENALEKAEAIVKGICDVLYDGKCFMFYNKKMYHAEAKEVCESRGWKMANIYSDDHYYIMLGYMRSLIPYGQDWTRYWIGLKLDSNSKRIYLSDGSEAPFLKWHRGNPQYFKGNSVVLQVKETTSDLNQHMWNSDGRSENIFGVICEY